MRITALVVALAGGVVPMGANGAGPGAQEPARAAIAAFSGRVEPDRVWVRFSDFFAVQAVNGELVWEKALAPARGFPEGSWAPAHHVDRAELRRQRDVAQASLGRALPDLSQEFILQLPAGADLEAAIDTLRAMCVVENALPVPLPEPPTLPPNYAPSQQYNGAATVGVGCSPTWDWPGGAGEDVRICDIEYSYNPSHIDLPPITRLGPPSGNNPWADHGTAVFGQMLSRNNSWGTVGGVYNADGYIAHPLTASGYSNAAAITNAIAGLRAGDIILIEQQMTGPTGVYCPVEWHRPTYDAIVQAVGNGIVVVEAAGNGGANLDGAAFNTGNGGHRPFQLANDSGAVIVGAGGAGAGGSVADRSRLNFSCYGATVDIQGWGERIVTCGYGDLFASEGANAWYTDDFGGTSGASPIVVNAAATVQGVMRAVTGSPLTPAQVREALMATGSPQMPGSFPVTQRIGPRPNAPAALMLLFGAADCDGNSRPDAVDIALSPALDADANGVPDACECGSVDYNNDGLFPDNQDLVDFLAVFGGGACSTGACGDLDFNNDGLFPDSRDVEAFFSVFGGGPCVR